MADAENRKPKAERRDRDEMADERGVRFGFLGKSPTQSIDQTPPPIPSQRRYHKIENKNNLITNIFFIQQPSIMSTSRILLCGGGNAIHVLAAYFGAKRDAHVTILSLYPGEADRLRDAIPYEGIRCANDLGEDIVGSPDAVISSASDVPDDLDLVILALPSFTHEMYLKALRPHLREGVSIGAMPGEGGFDLCAIHNLGGDFVRQCNLFAFETLPWACRILDYGSKVEVLGTKKDVDVVVSPKLGMTSKTFIDGTLQGLIGPLPHLTPADNFLSVTLMNINSVWHPTISWGFYHNLDLSKPFDEPPLFYQGASEETGEKLDKVSNEVRHLTVFL